MNIKIYLALILLLFSSAAFSQNTLEEQIMGKWKVTKIVQATDNPNLKDVINGFASATFNFADDHTFSVTTKSDSDLFKMFTNMANGKTWITKPNSVIAIGSKDDNYNVMKIIYKVEKNYGTFHIYETDLKLEVEKEL